VGQAVHQQDAVGQSGDRIVDGLVVERVLGALELGDLTGGRHDADRRAVLGRALGRQMRLELASVRGRP
jgi:hypothetical protein